MEDALRERDYLADDWRPTPGELAATMAPVILAVGEHMNRRNRGLAETSAAEDLGNALVGWEATARDGVRQRDSDAVPPFQHPAHWAECKGHDGEPARERV